MLFPIWNNTFFRYFLETISLFEFTNLIASPNDLLFVVVSYIVSLLTVLKLIYDSKSTSELLFYDN